MTDLSTWKPHVVIYHSPCDDGFGAAWAAWKRWGDEPIYYAATYGKPAPNVTGLNVLIVDFSYKRAELEAMAQQAASIVILDHHKTAKAELEQFQNFADHPERFTLETVTSMIGDLQRGGYPAVACLFDMERSGARMTWDFCHPGKEAPQLIRFIEDRDLWRFQLAYSRAFSLWLRSHRYDFALWDSLADQAENAIGVVMTQACAIETFYDQKIMEIVGTARWLPINNITVPVANCTGAFASDVAHLLLIKHPEAAFAATYYDRGDGSRTYSLRSEDERDDVSFHAKRYGGGGHRNAAGFEVPAI